MEKKLGFKEHLFIGSMLFGLFFGAGNLIFPVHMGQEAGANVSLAILGFLLTGIGLPFLGVITIGISKSSGVRALAARVHPKYAFIFTILLYLTIGPFFAVPRLATTSFQIGIAPFIAPEHQTSALAIFSVFFFLAAWFLSQKPSKVLNYVGKILNPLFLLLLAVLVFLAFFKPLGSISTAPVETAYIQHPFFKGFTMGYNTLDALASLAFGIVIVTTIRGMGVSNPYQIAKDTIKSGAISVTLMGIIYTLLSLMGTLSIGKFAMSENGGIALSQISQYYLGTIGMILLALIVTVACLKTAIGLIIAFAETFVELFPKVSYQYFVIFVSILPCIIANVGLTNIIQFSLPVLMFLYPLAITLMLLTIASPLFQHHTRVYQVTTYVTLLVACLDALNAMPEAIKTTGWAKTLLAGAERFLPFFSIGMGWIVPALLAFFCSLFWVSMRVPKKITPL